MSPVFGFFFPEKVVLTPAGVAEQGVHRVHVHPQFFGKRKQKPIEYDDEQECWESTIKIVDRSSTARNDIRQSLDVFGKIINLYVGYDAI